MSATKTINITAVPDREYQMIWNRLSERTHSNGMWMPLPPSKNQGGSPGRIWMYRKGESLFSRQKLEDGTLQTAHIQPLSQVMKEHPTFEDDMMKAQIQQSKPTLSESALQEEVAFIKEMRKSVEAIVRDTGLTPQQAFQLLEAGMVQSQMNSTESKQKED